MAYQKMCLSLCMRVCACETPQLLLLLLQRGDKMGPQSSSAASSISGFSFACRMKP